MIKREREEWHPSTIYKPLDLSRLVTQHMGATDIDVAEDGGEFHIWQSTKTRL